MNKLYNTQQDFASKINQFLLTAIPDIRKTQLKIIPFIVLGMILAESTVASDIAKKLKDDFSLVQFDSVIKRIKRFFKNKLFDPYAFYDSIIKYVIRYYKPKHNRIHIIFDHMFSHNNFTIFMISMRIGKHGIPLWFRCFKGIDCSEAFQESLLIEGISSVSNLFDSQFELYFLADRWFNSMNILKHIDSLGHIYRIRLRTNHKIFIYDKKEGHKVWKWVYDLKSYVHHSIFYNNIELTNENYITNIVISKSKGYDEPWIIVTNGDYHSAINDYKHRFGIESLFKNQKSNGFYLESTVNADIKYFTAMYSLVCFATLFLTILGSDFTKNTRRYRNVKITTHKTINGVKQRVLSLFNTGLTLFNIAYNSTVYIKIPYYFILYDS